MFSSFFIGGYECSDHINRNGERIDMLQATGHRARVEEDYQILLGTTISTVREGICWSRVESKPGQYDFKDVVKRIIAARKFGLQQIWDICHFGYPDDLSPLHPRFTERFVSLCRAFINVYNEYSSQPLTVIPINEISFLSWHSGEVRGTVPFAINSGFDIKYHLCKAAIAGIKAMKEEDPTCCVMMSEPLVKVHPRPGEEINELITQKDEEQFQAMDLITGRMCPELGGQTDFPDVVGYNYYHNCQWEYQGEPLLWKPNDERRISLFELLQIGYHRYNKPIVLTETGHFGEDRAEWLQEISEDCFTAIQNGVDLRGICIYPLIDRPDWDDLSSYCQCGLWDINSITKERFLHQPYLQAIMDCQNKFSIAINSNAHFIS
jgi:beta-glucosidase/6-phospho-beta-glucosidase/beta-galactosidase